MGLPNGQRAELGTKLEDSVLNPAHREERHKARVFESALGITAANAHLLRDALLEAAVHSEPVVAKGDNGFGQVYCGPVCDADHARRGNGGVRMDCPTRSGFSSIDQLLRGLSDEHRNSTA